MRKFKSLVFSLIVAFFFMGEMSAQLVAFPGAEGYGRFATGGRGNGTTGRVAIVTNLEDNSSNPPEGSFRWALQQGIETVVHPILGELEVKRPLTVVFAVSGVINLQSELRINRDNMTIAGQTAPGGQGIVFRGATLNFGGSSNVIIRFIRSRPGDEQGDNTDAFRLENGQNIIIDHCSFSWAIEETMHLSANRYSTVQWSIISESLYNSVHHKGPRGYATQWGGEYASYHHNILAHHNSRVPRINGSSQNDVEALVDYRNNVNYNWRSNGAFYGGEWENTNGQGFCHTNVVNNYFIPGPATSDPVFARPSLNRNNVPLDGYGKWYVDGNIMVGDEDMTLDNWLGIDTREVTSMENIYSDEVHLKTIDIAGEPGELEDYDAYTQTAEEAYAAVLEKAGAILPRRDVIDERVIAEIKGDINIVRYAYSTSSGQNTPMLGVASGLIDTPMNLVPTEDQGTKTAWDVYETVTSTWAPLDTDKDGIPDAWEIANGLDPNDPTDARTLCPDTGYSYLELYLHDLVSGDWTTSIPDSKKVSESNLVVFFDTNNDRISFFANDYIVEASIFDLMGTQIATQQVKGYKGNMTVSGIRTGVLLLQVEMLDGSTVVKKVLKK